jgi:hypothetical protein
MKLLLCALVLTIPFLYPQQPDRSDKRCVVTEAVTGGTFSDCGGWQATKGEKMIMPSQVNAQLHVGDVFYFVWKETRWVAEIKSSPQQPELKVFDCVVTEVKAGVGTVVGDSRTPHCAPTDNQEICAHVTLDIPLDSWPQVWRKAERGAVVQAQWVGGRFEPVAATTEQKCGTYHLDAVNAVKDGPPKREGCAPPASQFIRDLLEGLNKP